MDTRTQNKHIKKEDVAIPPAQLWISTTTVLEQKCYTYLQKLLCPDHGCDTCITCMQIKNKQHHSVCYMQPENYYTLDQINQIINTMSFALNPDQQFFFIIEKADMLSVACANRLLKPLEEPPPGYYFILLAQRINQIEKTIRSRCFINSWHEADTVAIEYQQLFNFCTTTKDPSAYEFLSYLYSCTINERASIELLDAILKQWLQQYKKAVIKQQFLTIKRSEHAISILKRALTMPPMPGSAKIFWKNIFLQMYE